VLETLITSSSALWALLYYIQDLLYLITFVPSLQQLLLRTGRNFIGDTGPPPLPLLPCPLKGQGGRGTKSGECAKHRA